MLYPIQMNFGSSSRLPNVPQADAMVSPKNFDAVDLAYRLSKLSTFLPAAHELLSVFFEFKYIITTRKTVRLLELARKTLERAGVSLYSFASCPEAFIVHKEAYVDLLKILQANDRQENTELRGRIRILLMPLTSNFSVQKRGGGINARSANSPQRHSRTPSASFRSGENIKNPNSSSPTAQLTMLPPDAFPAAIHAQSSLPIRSSPIERGQPPLWDCRQLEKISTSKRHLDQENQSVKYRPPKMSKKFGIYCIRGSSMANLNSFRRNERQTFIL